MCKASGAEILPQVQPQSGVPLSPGLLLGCTGKLFVVDTSLLQVVRKDGENLPLERWLGLLWLVPVRVGQFGL